MKYLAQYLSKMNNLIRILGVIWVLSSSQLMEAFSTLPIRSVSKLSQDRMLPSQFSMTSPTTDHVHRAMVGVNLFTRKNEEIQNRPYLSPLSRVLSLFKILRKLDSVQKYRKGLFKTSRKMVQILATTCMIYMSAGVSMNSMMTPRAHASSSSTLSISQQKSPIATTKDQIILDRMVDKYVKKYMFQDDVYDSLESTYRELYTDVTAGKYPIALAETASTALGRNKDVQQALKVTRFDPEKLFFDKMLEIQDILFNRYGMSKSVSRPLLFMAGIVLPLFSLFFLATTFAINQKAMTERMAIKRYGESILSAEEKPEDDEDIEVEEDDEEENDEEDESDTGGNKIA